MTDRVAIVTGGSSGLGQQIVEALRSSFTHIYDISKSGDLKSDGQVARLHGDVRDEDDIEQVYIEIATKHKKVDALVNCAGINHIEFIPALRVTDWNRIMDTNAKGIFVMVKQFIGLLAGGGTVLNIVSNASHMPMTSSLAYNASKGAAAIMTKQMSRELIKTHGITVFGISPNKLSGTGMSAYIDRSVQELRGWTAEEARAYQLASLPAGEETDTKVLAEFIGFLLSSKERHKYLAGCDIPYGL